MAKKSSISELNRTCFDEESEGYDDSIFIKARAYQELHEVVLSLIDLAQVKEGPVLELGVGTGTLAERILERSPAVRLDGYDISEGMIRQAQEKLSRYGDRVRLFQKDVTTDLPSGLYQVIITSYTIHHLHPREQRRLFHRLFPIVSPGGRIIVADMFKPDTEALADMYDQLRRKDIEAQGFDLKEYEEEMNHSRHGGGSVTTYTTRYTRYVRWMTRAGFVNADCVWKYLSSAVIYAERPASAS